MPKLLDILTIQYIQSAAAFFLILLIDVHSGI